MKSPRSLFALGLALAATATAGFSAPAHPAIRTAEFIYEPGPYPQCHASTIVETTGGELLAAWFGGTAESNPDVCIYIARREQGRWSAGVKVADGVQHDAKRYPCWNPVLFQPRVGPLQLYYKVGPSPETWWGMLMTSTDGGRTWDEPRRLPEDVLGPIKNKPIQLADGTLLSGSSTEDRATKAWEVHVERSSDLGRTWQLTGPINSGGKFNSIQPSILTYADGRLQLLCRSKEKTLTTSWSRDQGRTWSPLVSSGLYNPNSGSDAVTLADGRQLLVYNLRDRAGGAPGNSKSNALGGAQPSIADANDDWGVRWPLNVSLSSDGERWDMRVTLEDQPLQHGYAYPAVIQTRDGLIHITYTWNREKIKHVVLDPKKL
ncbi:MAG: exo-alpha-sialidase [Undibacterium sp.]|nr:exo-alpha-sialidase [Opitutaceae bacterium]